jgi:hypothetical protein
MSILSPVLFFLSLFGYKSEYNGPNGSNDIYNNESSKTCPAYIRYIGTGLSRTGTQTLTHKLVNSKDGQLGVYNSMRQMQLGHLEMVRASVPCNGVTESFKTWYYNVLASSTTPVLASIDVPLNFCYKEIAELQMEAGYNNFSLLMTYRHPDEWVRSFKYLLAAFAPIAGFPYSFLIGDMVTHTAEQFRHHLNCTIEQQSILGFTIAAWLEDPLACTYGFMKWNQGVVDFSTVHNLRLENYTLGSISDQSFGVNSKELLFLAFVSRIPYIFCLMVLCGAVQLFMDRFL